MSDALPEYRPRPRVSTRLAAATLAVMAVFGTVATVFSTYLVATNPAARPQALFVGALSTLIAVVFGGITLRFLSRMQNIKRVRTLDASTLEIETRRGKVLQARLPKDVEQLVRTDNDLCVHLKIGAHRLIISPEEFTDAPAIQLWFRNALVQSPS